MVEINLHNTSQVGVLIGVCLAVGKVDDTVVDIEDADLGISGFRGPSYILVESGGGDISEVLLEDISEAGIVRRLRVLIPVEDSVEFRVRLRVCRIVQVVEGVEKVRGVLDSLKLLGLP